ncbi:hypothetical protein ACMFMF_001070 [Clarireedia jacksonii]
MPIRQHQCRRSLERAENTCINSTLDHTPRDVPADTAVTSATTFHCFPNLPKELRDMIWECSLSGGRIVNIFQQLTNQTLRDWQEAEDRPQPKQGTYEVDKIDDGESAISYQQSLAWASVDQMIALGHSWKPRCWREYIDIKLVSFRSPSSTPAMLLACRESRRIALQHYERAFATPAKAPSIWFDFKHDTLYLRSSTMSFEASSNSEEFFNASLMNALWTPDQKRWCKVKKLALQIHKDDFYDLDFDEMPPIENTYYNSFITRVLQWFPDLDELHIVLQDKSQLHDDDDLVLTKPFSPITLDLGRSQLTSLEGKLKSYLSLG